MRPYTIMILFLLIAFAGAVIGLDTEVIMSPEHCELFTGELGCNGVALWSDGTLEMEIEGGKPAIIDRIEASSDTYASSQKTSLNCSSGPIILQPRQPQRIKIYGCDLEGSGLSVNNLMRYDIKIYFTNYTVLTEEGRVMSKVTLSNSKTFEQVQIQRIAEEIAFRDRWKKAEQKREREIFTPLILYVFLLTASFAILKLRKIKYWFFLSWGLSLLMTAVMTAGSVLFAILFSQLELLAIVLIFGLFAGVALGYYSMKTFLPFFGERTGWLPLIFYAFNCLIIWFVILFMSRMFIAY